VAGSFRRRKETVGDLDILVTARKDSPVMQRFTEFDEVAEVLSHGKTRSTVVIKILPSPILPVRAAWAIASTARST